MLSLIIPSHNEAGFIGPCLDAIARQDLPAGHNTQVIVAANACADGTVAEADSRRRALESAGFDLVVLDLPEPGKTKALNSAEAKATQGARAYLDADIVMDPGLLAELRQVLDQTAAIYAGGAVRIPRPKSWISRAYAKVWTDLPFFRDGVPGIGLFATNAAGRARWEEWPHIIADDRFARLQFSADERVRLRSGYDWPLAEGALNLIETRRRWCEGNDEVDEIFPELTANDSERNRTAGGVVNLLKTPLASLIYVTITMISRRLSVWYPRRSGWRRGR